MKYIWNFIYLMLILALFNMVFGQKQKNEDTIKPGDNLVIQGIPSVPAELVETVKK